MAVGTQQDLAVVRFQLLDSVEEFLLDHALAVEEIDIVDDEHVDAAEPLTKAGQRAFPQGLREVVREPFRRKKEHAQSGMPVRNRR